MGKLEDGLAAYKRSEYATAMSLLLPLAEEGNAVAQCNVASYFHAGLGVKADGVKAAYWYLRAGEQQDLRGGISGLAFHNLSSLYLTGAPGIGADKLKAAEYLSKARALGVDLYERS